MDLSAKTPPAFGKSLLLFFALIVIGVLLITAPLVSFTAYAQEERVFENTLPKEVPLKVTIKKEKEQSFKDLKNEKWVRELELELTNTGDKPIYFLDMSLITNVAPGIGVTLDNMREGGHLVLRILFGRGELGDLISKPRPDDVPIKPGETYVFTFQEQAGGWERSIRRGDHPQPTRVQLLLYSLSFGDGTGLFGSGGQPYPPPRKQ
jgi:hypothetical protein